MLNSAFANFRVLGRLRDLFDFLVTFFDGVEIGEHQLGVDDLDIP